AVPRDRVNCSPRRVVSPAPTPAVVPRDFVALDAGDRVASRFCRFPTKAIRRVFAFLQRLLALPECESQSGAAIGGREAHDALKPWHRAHRRKNVLVDVAHSLIKLLSRASLEPAHAYPHRLFPSLEDPARSVAAAT